MAYWREIEDRFDSDERDPEKWVEFSITEETAPNGGSRLSINYNDGDDAVLEDQVEIETFLGDLQEIIDTMKQNGYSIGPSSRSRDWVAEPPRNQPWKMGAE